MKRSELAGLLSEASVMIENLETAARRGKQPVQTVAQVRDLQRRIQDAAKKVFGKGESFEFTPGNAPSPDPDEEQSA